MKTSLIRSAVYIFVLLILVVFYKHGRGIWVPIYQKFSGKNTVEDIIGKYGSVTRSRMTHYFKTAGVDYPPKKITLLALKKERLLELWASNGNAFKYIRSYKIQGTSGKSGPKLNEGDRQVPEGIYKIIGLNPNSGYHLSMKINYPNNFDLFHAKQEGRTQPGTDIFIHGKNVSIGCLAMGDKAIEELFVLVHDVGKSRTKVVIAPSDPRKTSINKNIDDGPVWLSKLYEELSTEYNKYKL